MEVKKCHFDAISDQLFPQMEKSLKESELEDEDEDDEEEGHNYIDKKPKSKSIFNKKKNNKFK